jgi:hypothetical protein
MVRQRMAAHTQAGWTLKEPKVEVLGSDAAARG